MRVQGLRGIASLLVVTSHLARAFAPTFLAPAENKSDLGSIFHLPFLRLPAQGPPWVALFFLLTGYVNAMKPMKQARNGSVGQALSGLSSSTLRRTGRLVLPTTVATLVSWMLCQLGGYRIGKTCDATWIRDTSPSPTAGFIAPLRSLVHNCFTTWSNGSNAYDPIQWTFAFPSQGVNACVPHAACNCPYATERSHVSLYGSILFQLGWTRSCVKLLPSPSRL